MDAIAVASRMRDAALAYARQGLPVFPLHNATDDGSCSCADAECSSVGKHPRTSHGLKDATTDESVIRHWWKRWPDANVGIATGAASGLVVLDVDGEVGERSLLDLPVFESGPAVSTPRGAHFLFSLGELDVANSAGKLGAGLDVRGSGGYVVAPPSRGATGPYEWMIRLEERPLPPWPYPIAAAPEPAPPATWRVTDAAPTPYGLRALTDEIELIRRAPEGGRNDQLNRSAFALGQLIAGRELDRADVEAALLSAALTAGLGESESRRTIHSGIESGLRSPRSAPAAAIEPEINRNGASSEPPRLPAEEPPSFRPIGEVLAAVDVAGPRRWLVEGIILEGAHGVLGAVAKAGKGWDAIDLTVSVASGTDWLERFAVSQGPVVLFAAEEDDHEIVRRLRAVCASRSLDPALLPIYVGARIPRHGETDLIDRVAQEVAACSPALVIIDPLYIAAAGADHRSLYEMGGLLDRLRDLVRPCGAALLVVTHFNRNAAAEGAGRLTGAGPSEWGRFLITAELSPHQPPAEAGTRVTREVRVVGSSVADLEFRCVRRIVAAAADDPSSPLTYSVEVADSLPATSNDGLNFTQRRVLAVLDDREAPASIDEIGDRLANDGEGKPLKRSTRSDALNRLAELGLADGTTGQGQAKLWWRT